MIKHLFYLFIFLGGLSSSCIAEEYNNRFRYGNIYNTHYAFMDTLNTRTDLPYNIVTTTNRSNFLQGVIEGGFKGSVYAIRYVSTALVDTVTAVIPGQTIISSNLIRKDFDVDAQHYGYYDTRYVDGYIISDGFE